jgi:hypothetical protein
MRCYLLARAQNRTTRPLSEVTNCTRSVSAARRSVIRPRVYSSSGQLECRGYVVKLADALTPDISRVDWNAIYQARRAEDAHAVSRQTLLGVFVREPAAHVSAAPQPSASKSAGRIPTTVLPVLRSAMRRRAVQASLRGCQNDGVDWRPVSPVLTTIPCDGHDPRPGYDSSLAACRGCCSGAS